MYTVGLLYTGGLLVYTGGALLYNGGVLFYAGGALFYTGGVLYTEVLLCIGGLAEGIVLVVLCALEDSIAATVLYVLI